VFVRIVAALGVALFGVVVEAIFGEEIGATRLRLLLPALGG